MSRVAPAAALRLTNPVANLQEIVSCASVDATGQPSTVNVETGPFPATARGNATIEATVSLPSPCVAPIVFVTSPSGAWFAATGDWGETFNDLRRACPAGRMRSATGGRLGLAGALTAW